MMELYSLTITVSLNSTSQCSRNFETLGVHQQKQYFIQILFSFFYYD